MGQPSQISINSYAQKTNYSPQDDKDTFIRILCEDYLKKSNKTEFIKLSNSNLILKFKWGNPLVFGTPSYWIIQTQLVLWNKNYFSYALGKNLFEETIACLLGGYGIPAEVGLKAFEELKYQGLTTFPC